MNAIKIIPSLVAISLLASCAATSPKKDPIQFIDISYPELNKDASATLGEKLLTQATGYYAESLIIEAMDAHTADIPSTTTFYRVGNSNYFESDINETVIQNNGFGSPLEKNNYVLYTAGEDKFCVNIMNCFSSKEATFKYNANKTLRVKKNSFQQVIEYNGKSGSTLKFTYREFSDDMARSAFTTDFTIDLKESSQIGYKGAIIEVTDASNSVIKYKVLKNFNK